MTGCHYSTSRCNIIVPVVSVYLSTRCLAYGRVSNGGDQHVASNSAPCFQQAGFYSLGELSLSEASLLALWFTSIL